MQAAKIRVLIVDDSALVRKILTDLLGKHPDIEVVGSAADAFLARELIKTLNPDVLTLDVEMPRMDGITFLRNLMRLRPMPVVMVSSLTERGAEITLDALAAGAVDFLAKPKLDVAATLGDYRSDLVEKIKAAAKARVRRLSQTKVVRPDVASLTFRMTNRLVALGASTGGTEAIKDFLLAMPADSPAVVIAQHIPKAFSASFAARLNRICPMTVCEAQDGQPIRTGHAYIAPGDRHLLIVRSGARWFCRLDNGPPVNRHKPSVDVLFRSVAEQAGFNAIGVLLTGMGKDGAAGLKEMREAGSPTIAQDEATSVVWGMPGQAVQLGAAAEVVPLPRIAGRVIALANATDTTCNVG